VEAILNDDAESAEDLFTADEIAGLKLFIGEAHCMNCHNGPLFTNNDFHNTGVPAVKGLPQDTGRANGAQQILTDEFSCLSTYSDAGPEDCAELRFIISEESELQGQFKPPSLRNVAARGPFMHASQFATLEEVLHHYNTAPQAPVGQSEIHSLNLDDRQIVQIIAFLRTLDSPINADSHWLTRPQ
jgi:cytochrome c peroxidase